MLQGNYVCGNTAIISVRTYTLVVFLWHVTFILQNY